jgi:hypothetical protein
MLSIQHLFELTRGRRGGFGRHSRPGQTYNAPMFAWSVYHDGAKPPWIPGKAGSHVSVQWNGIDIDKEIPLSVVKKLNSIKGIEGRASCQGHTNDPGIPDVNSYFIFRTDNQNENYIKNVVNKLNRNNDIKAGYGLGGWELNRIVVVAPFSYDSNPKEFKKWWINLPKIIKNAL